MFESWELGVGLYSIRGGFFWFFGFLVSGDDDVGNGTVCGGFVCGLHYVMLCYDMYEEEGFFFFFFSFFLLFLFCSFFFFLFFSSSSSLHPF